MKDTVLSSVVAYIRRHHIGLLALAVALGGTAYAAIPARNGTIKACYTTKGGALRVVDEKTRRCPRGQKLLSWNQRGRRGPRGLQGLQGPQGQQGGEGQQGVPGQPGAPAARHFATVSQTGGPTPVTSLTSGTATGVSRDSQGKYTVRFPADVSRCSAVVTPGRNRASDPNANTTGRETPEVWPGYEFFMGAYAPESSSVSVRFFVGSTLTDTSFHVAVFC